MNLLNRILRRINHKDMPLPLGRWKLELCNQKTNQKIDSSNEDHCGTCANGILEKPRELPHTTFSTFHLDSVLPIKSLVIYKHPDNQIKPKEQPGKGLYR